MYEYPPKLTGLSSSTITLFVPGLTRVSEEEYSEQVDRMKAGLIPNLNDLGAVQAAKDTIAKYGDEE